MTDSLLVGLLLAVQISIVLAFFWMAYNVAAIRRMLENAGLFSGFPCPWCRMPIPEGAKVCGHCGREVTRVDAP